MLLCVEYLKSPDPNLVIVKKSPPQIVKAGLVRYVKINFNPLIRASRRFFEPGRTGRAAPAA